MSFECTISDVGAARLVAVCGRVDSATAGDLEKSLQNLFDHAGRHAILELSALNYISSAGLRIVLMAAKRAKVAQSKLVLCGLAPHVREVFAISGFMKILDVADDQAAALARIG